MRAPGGAVLIRVKSDPPFDRVRAVRRIFLSRQIVVGSVRSGAHVLVADARGERGRFAMADHLPIHARLSQLQGDWWTDSALSDPGSQGIRRENPFPHAPEANPAKASHEKSRYTHA
jgi:hypothetical protein